MKHVYSLTCVTDDPAEAYALLERYLQAGMVMTGEQTLEAVVDDHTLKSFYLELVQTGKLVPEATAPLTEATPLPPDPLYQLTRDPLSQEQHMEPTPRGRQMLRAKLS